MVGSKGALWPVQTLVFPSEVPLDIFLHSVDSVDIHIHSAVEILLVVSGGLFFYGEAGEERRLSAQDVAIVHSWQPHATQSPGTPNVLLALQFDPSIARHDPHFGRRRFDLSSDRQGEVDPAVLVRLRSLAARIFLETRMKRSAWQMEAEALLLQVVALLVRRVPHRLVPETSTGSRPYDERQLSVHLRKATDFIRRNSSEPVRLEQVASAHGLSSGHLSRLFKQETGESFGNFVTQIRLLRALELLKAPNRPTILSIALDCGFPNVKSFNLAFRRTFDCVPTEWRQTEMTKDRLSHPYQQTDEAPSIAVLQEWARL